jgi:hypothetical protein
METFMGVPIVSSLDMTETIEDWSRVRSPSRARRRRKRGYRQNITIRVVPKKVAIIMNGTMYVHPTYLQQLKHQLELETGRRLVQ